MDAWVWRAICLLLLPLLIYSSDAAREIHSAYSALLSCLSPAPLGWKLEPRLYRAITTGVSFYQSAFDRFVFVPLLPFAPPAVLAAGLTWTLLSGRPAGMIAAALALLCLSGGSLVALLSFVGSRVCARMGNVLFSLVLLFGGRMHSVLKLRSEPIPEVSLDKVILGLLLFTAVLLLYPVLLLHALLFYAMDAPRAVMWRWLCTV